MAEEEITWADIRKLAKGVVPAVVIAVLARWALVAYYGDTYVGYRKRVGMLVPGIGKRG